MSKVRVCHTVTIPDPFKISRYHKNPELGPRILFFSGGTALTGLSKTLKNYTHNSIHLVTPFDSGGSSSELRRAFDMPSIGDLRSRMMALADESVLGHPEIYQLFSYRFSKSASQKELLIALDEMSQGKSDLMSVIASPMRELICNQLGYFIDRMPADFDLRGASVGNLILTGGYLNNHQSLDLIIFLFSKLVNVQGTVCAVVNDNLHLAAELSGGRWVLGQHLLTGKEVAPLTSPIKSLSLTSSLSKYQPTSAKLKKKNHKLIQQAELICYPPGSFYSSLMANLLPQGVGQAIAENNSPKVYIPNLGRDPEQIGMSFEQSVNRLIAQLRNDCSEACDVRKLLNIVMVDSNSGLYPSAPSRSALRALGIELVDTKLVTKTSEPYYDAELLVSALLSLTK